MHLRVLSNALETSPLDIKLKLWNALQSSGHYRVNKFTPRSWSKNKIARAPSWILFLHNIIPFDILKDFPSWHYCHLALPYLRPSKDFPRPWRIFFHYSVQGLAQKFLSLKIVQGLAESFPLYLTGDVYNAL